MTPAIAAGQDPGQIAAANQLADDRPSDLAHSLLGTIGERRTGGTPQHGPDISRQQQLLQQIPHADHPF